MDRPTQRPPNSVLIQGDTFPVKEKLKVLGGIWDKQMVGWWLPKENASAARAMIDNMEGQMSFGDEEL